MTNYGVKYGAKNDGPRVVKIDGDKDKAKEFAESVGGRVVELDENGAEKRPTRAATKTAADKPGTPPAG